MCPFDNTLLQLVRKLDTREPFYHTSLIAVFTQTDHPKSVRNRFVIEVFGGVFMLSIGCCIFCWYEGFRHRTESDLVLFLCTYIIHIYMLNIFILTQTVIELSGRIHRYDCDHY